MHFLLICTEKLTQLCKSWVEWISKTRSVETRLVIFDFIRANWTQLLQHLVHTRVRARHACRSNQQRQQRQQHRRHGRGRTANSSAVYTYNLDTVSRARRGGPEGEVSSISRTPLRLSATGTAPLRGRPTPPARSSRSRWTKEGRRGTRGKEGELLRPSRLDSSRVTASSAVSQAPSGSIRLPPLRPQLPPPSTAKSNAPTVPAASRPPPFAPTLSPPPRARAFSPSPLPLLSLWLLPPASVRWV